MVLFWELVEHLGGVAQLEEVGPWVAGMKFAAWVCFCFPVTPRLEEAQGFEPRLHLTSLSLVNLKPLHCDPR